MTSEILPPTAKSVIIAMNPNSGASDQGQLVEQLLDELTQRGFTARVLTKIDEVTQTVQREWADGTLRAVVAAGGDGTISLLANELHNDVPLAILPLGTENLLAKFLDLPGDPTHIADLIARGQTIRLDAGRANGKLFLVMASCGFDADVVQRLHSNRRGHIRHWSYARPIMRAIRQYRYPTLRIQIDDQPKRITGKWLFVFNVPRYAMNLPIVHDADAMDGKLDLCTFGRGRLIRGLLYLAAILTRQHRWKKTRVRRFEKLRVEADEPVPYQLDGDPGGELPLEIEIQPKLLRVVVSKRWIDKNVPC